MQHSVHQTNSLLLSPGHACSYLPGKTARLVFLVPGTTSQARVYSRLAEQGFRRSGPYLYRPGCEHCHACIPIRIPVEIFKPARNQRRTWQRNQDLVAKLRPAAFIEEHLNLYQRYMQWRHPHLDLERTSAADFAALLTGNDAAFLVEFRLHRRLVSVAVVDELDEALSAVYTFYTPELPHRSLGTYAILWQIAEARRHRLHHVYLGYWIAESSKMAYKSRFRPFEQLTEDGWTTVI